MLPARLLAAELEPPAPGGAPRPDGWPCAVANPTATAATRARGAGAGAPKRRDGTLGDELGDIAQPGGAPKRMVRWCFPVTLTSSSKRCVTL